MSALRILGLDTSGKTASVAILDTECNLLLGEHTVYTSRTHSQVILPMCKALLEECRLDVSELDCMAVAVGPGSYTGLRIGIAAVQGMAMANQTPCIGVSTLEAMASRMPFASEVLAVMYARENLFYSALFRYTENGLERIVPDALRSVPELSALLEGRTGTVVTGEGAEVFMRQYSGNMLQLAPAALRMQSASGVCTCAACYSPGTPAELTASYLQAVQIQKKKTDNNTERKMDL